MRFLTYILVAGFISIPIFAVIICYFHSSLMTSLRNDHPEKWQELGSPTLIKNNSIRSNIAMIKFLMKNEYLELNDHNLTNKCSFLRIFYSVYIVWLVIILIDFIIILSSSGVAH